MAFTSYDFMRGVGKREAIIVLNESAREYPT
jgi:hypothetical protein